MAGNGDNLIMAETTKLVGAANYSVWKFRIWNVLQKEDLWDVVNHDPTLGAIVAVPAVLPADADAAAIATAHVEANMQLARRQTRALAILCLSVRDEIIPHISEISDPAVVWATVKSLYETSGNARKLLLKSRLYNLKLEEGGSVSEFLKEVKDISNQLIAIGETVSNDEIVEHVLNALPKSYEHFVSSIGLRDHLPDVTTLTGLLLHDEARRELCGSRRLATEAHLARSSRRLNLRKGISQKNRSGQRTSTHAATTDNGTSKLAYHWCFKDSHLMRDCPDLSAELRRRADDHKKKSGTVANATTFSDSNEEFQEADDVPAEDKENDCDLDQIEAHLTSSWCVDSGASKHITGDIDAFENFRSVDSPTSIKIADGKAYPVIGTAEASVSSTKDEIKFQKVLYVPGVTKNLLSVGKIANQNYGVYFNSTHCFIIEPPNLRNLGQIIASGTRDRHNGLYKYSSQVSEALAITSIESSQVWHD